MKKIMIAAFLLTTLSIFPLIRAQSVEVISKNLLNPDVFATTSSTLISNSMTPLEGGKTYTLSLPMGGPFEDYEIHVYDDQLMYVQATAIDLGPCLVNSQDGFLECTFSLNVSSPGVYIDIYSWDFKEMFTLNATEGFQLEEGSVRTTYVPYEERVIVDTTAPIFQGEAYYITSYEVPTSLNDIITNHVSVIDEIDGNISDRIVIENDPYTGNETTLGTYAVSLTASDYSGNQASFILNIVVQDQVKPIITGPDEVRTNINDLASIDSLIQNHYSFSDGYDGVITTYTLNTDAYTNSMNQLGSYQVKFSIEDASGNNTSKTITIEVFDDEAPLISGNASITHSLSSIKTINDYLKDYIATDNVDTSLTVSIQSHTMSSTLDTVGTYELILTSTDTSGNTATKTVSFIITDDIAPTLLGLKNHTISYKNTFDITAYIQEIVVSDNVDALSFTDISVVLDTYTMNQSTPGIYDIHFSVSDHSGNETLLKIQVEVIDDIAPVFSFSQSIILEMSMTLSDDDMYNMLLSAPHIKAFNPTSYKAVNTIDYDNLEDQFIEFELTNEEGKTITEAIKVTIVEPTEETFNILWVVVPFISVSSIITITVILKKRF